MMGECRGGTWRRERVVASSFSLSGGDKARPMLQNTRKATQSDWKIS